MTNLSMNHKEFLWCEKYRPKTIDETILPQSCKDIAKGYIHQGRIANLLFSGGAGVGKTTLAKAMCDEVGSDWIIINGSDEGRNIDVLRTKITQFASTASFSGNKKVVILDEGDYLNPTSVQPALRNFIEQFSSNCTFILTCNYKNRLIEPLHSRFKNIDFKISTKDKPVLAAQFFKRLTQILETEKVAFDKKVVAELINKYFPDFRKAINELQSFSVAGNIDSSILINFSDDAFNELTKFLKEKKFNDMRKWVANHSDEASSIFTMIYDKCSEKLEAKSLPSLILLLAQYQFQAAHVANQEINTAAFLTEVMMSDLSWK